MRDALVALLVCGGAVAIPVGLMGWAAVIIVNAEAKAKELDHQDSE